MKLDVRQLVQLAAVAQAGGVTEGAALLGLSQPALSRTLSMLEKRVGEPLFVSGLQFQELLPGRNVVACRPTHPLLIRRKLRTRELFDYPWIAPPPGNPLLADLSNMLLSLGATEIKIRYAGGSLASVVNYIESSDALTVLPQGVVFAYRDEKSITALPVNIAHPHCALGLLRRSDALRSPVLDAFSAHIRKNLDTLKYTIKRHEQAVVWGG